MKDLGKGHLYILPAAAEKRLVFALENSEEE